MATTENAVHRAVIDISKYSREATREAIEKALRFSTITVNDPNILFAIIDDILAQAHDKAFRAYEKTFRAYKEEALAAQANGKKKK